MKINGLTVDAEKLGTGLYGIICDAGEESIVAFGMIPKWTIDLFQKQLRDKILDEAAKQMACDKSELTPHLDEKAIAKTIAAIEHQVCIGIYSAAAKAGMMRC